MFYSTIVRHICDWSMFGMLSYAQNISKNYRFHAAMRGIVLEVQKSYCLKKILKWVTKRLLYFEKAYSCGWIHFPTFKYREQLVVMDRVRLIASSDRKKEFEHFNYRQRNQSLANEFPYIKYLCVVFLDLKKFFDFIATSTFLTVIGSQLKYIHQRKCNQTNYYR